LKPKKKDIGFIAHVDDWMNHLGRVAFMTSGERMFFFNKILKRDHHGILFAFVILISDNPFKDGSFGMQRMVVPKSHTVFHSVILFIFIAICVFPGTIFSQETGRQDWRNSAKSLTVFQPGDAVRIQIWELYQDERRNINLSADYPINPEGFIIMPLVGEVRVKGLTIFELMQSLEERYAAYLMNPYIYVRPLVRITMQGAFNQPGAYRIDPQSSLWDLVAQAGGPTARCDLKRISVERGGKVVIRDLLSSFEKGYSLEEIGIESGDQIRAPARFLINLPFFMNIIGSVGTLLLLYLRIRTRS
jgi:polysaccharide export outer membrane protein